jgi:hypothetical protein
MGELERSIGVVFEVRFRGEVGAPLRLNCERMQGG